MKALLFPPKTSVIHSLSDAFRGYRKRLQNVLCEFQTGMKQISFNVPITENIQREY